MKANNSKLISGILLSTISVIVLSLTACNSQEDKAENIVDDYLQEHLNEIFPDAQSIKVIEYGKLTEEFDSIPQNEEYLKCDSLIALYDSLETQAEQLNQNKKVKIYSDSLDKYISYQDHLDPQMKWTSLGYKMEVSAKLIDKSGREDIYHLTFDFLTPTELWSYKANGQEKTIYEE